MCVRAQAYGYEHLATLNNLERVRLLRLKKGDSTWPALTKYGRACVCGRADVCVTLAPPRRHFRLIYGDVNTTEPNDIAYVTAGYARAAAAAAAFGCRLLSVRDRVHGAQLRAAERPPRRACDGGGRVERRRGWDAAAARRDA